MVEGNELVHYKLQQQRKRMLEHLRESGILDNVISDVEYTESVSTYGMNVITGEPSLELSIQFTLYEEVALYAEQVKALHEGTGVYKLLDGKYVRPINVEVVYKTVGEKETIVSFYYNNGEHKSNFARQMNYYFSTTQNGTNHVGSMFEIHETIIEGAYNTMKSVTVKPSDSNMYSKILDEIILPSNSDLMNLLIQQGAKSYLVVMEKNKNKVDLEVLTDRGLSHRLGVLVN